MSSSGSVRKKCSFVAGLAASSCSASASAAATAAMAADAEDADSEDAAVAGAGAAGDVGEAKQQSSRRHVPKRKTAFHAWLRLSPGMKSSPATRK